MNETKHFVIIPKHQGRYERGSWPYYLEQEATNGANGITRNGAIGRYERGSKHQAPKSRSSEMPGDVRFPRRIGQEIPTLKSSVSEP